ncbi:MAG: hypothetical protein ACE5R6_11930 [Candidatus Heimdallarchaeota archaeon]
MTDETTMIKETVLCEICEKTRVPKKPHFRCSSCGKYTCSDCARYEAVFVRESTPLSLHVRSRRVCPNCKIKTRATRGRI